MTNQEVTSLLRDVQKLWQKWRDVPLEFFGDADKWDEILYEANRILADHGSTDHVYNVVGFFVDELHERSREAELAKRESTEAGRKAG